MHKAKEVHKLCKQVKLVVNEKKHGHVMKEVHMIYLSSILDGEVISSPNWIDGFGQTSLCSNHRA